ncbi:MAG: hypothetical protein H0U60_19540 [Blastocatellia bacterium]|nr:hypothetical protein [Blastocatellia bacterium]
MKLVNLVMTEKEAIAFQMLASVGVAALVKDISVLPTMMRNLDVLFTIYFTNDEKEVISTKLSHLCDAVSPELMESMHLKVADWL